MMPLLPIANTLTLLGPTLLGAVVESQVFLGEWWDNPYIAWGTEISMISLPYSMLATLLAAFIERPFIRSAGFRQNALLFSIRANIWSWLFGTTLAYAFLLIGPINELFFAVLILLAVPLSIALEGVYLRGVAKRNEFSLSWRPLVWGNIVSGIVCQTQVAVGQAWGNYLQNRGAEVITWLRAYRELTSFGVLFFCLAVFILAFVYPAVEPKKNPDVPTHSPTDAG
jgi:hypothetical protein